MSRLKKHKKWLIPVSSAILVIIAAAVFLLFKIGQQSANLQKWKDYDDYGWS
ncbi:MAG: hypothetical protein FWD34_00840 [Oscillospiraceae bacterium]|nr:hypothetical protein [Oscillospiraceae bacterium]